MYSNIKNFCKKHIDIILITLLFSGDLIFIFTGLMIGSHKPLSIEYRQIWTFFSDPRLIGIQPHITDLLFPSDGHIYLNLAKNGYNTNFFLSWFPLYPWMFYLFDLIINNIRISALIVSNLASLISIIAIFKLISIDFGRRIAWIATVLLIIFPYSIFLHTGHSESVFLLMAVSAFYFFRKKNYLLCALFVFLGCLARPYGFILYLALAPFLLFDSIKGKYDHNMFFVFLSPISLFFYSFFSYRKTGDWLFWIHNRARLSVGGSISLDNFLHLSTTYLSRRLTTEIYLIIIFISILALSLFLLPKIRKLYHYWIYAFLIILTPILMNNLLGYGRFLVSAFPIFLFTSCLISHNKKIFLFATPLVFLVLLYFQFILAQLVATMFFVA